MITIGEVNKPYFLWKFDVHGWTNKDSSVVHDGITYTPDTPIYSIEGLGNTLGEINATRLKIKLIDPTHVYRNTYRTTFPDKELKIFYVPRNGAAPIEMTTMFCVGMTSVVLGGRGRTTEFEFGNRLARLNNLNVRLPTASSQRGFHSNDDSQDLAQTTISLTWGGTPRT